MPRHSKHKAAKRAWYEQGVNSPQKTRLQKLFRYALHHDWELRPQHLGIWVIARRRFRLFVTYASDGDTFQECLLVVNGEEDERKLTEQQMLKAIKRWGRLYEP